MALLYFFGPVANLVQMKIKNGEMAPFQVYLEDADEGASHWGPGIFIDFKFFKNLNLFPSRRWARLSFVERGTLSATHRSPFVGSIDIETFFPEDPCIHPIIHSFIHPFIILPPVIVLTEGTG